MDCMRKIRLLIAFGLFLAPGFVMAQRGAVQEEPNAAADTLRKYEMELKAIGDSMIDGQKQGERIKALLKYVPLLVKTLKLEGSYDYPFDSLSFMKVLKPEDGSFRI